MGLCSEKVRRQSRPLHPEVSFFTDGVTDEVIAALSRFQTFAVVARGSSFVYKDRPIEVPDVARMLGVRYLLEGSVRRDKHRLRVAARLSDASGLVLWADNFEEELGGVFEIQDRIAAQVIGVAEPQITSAELDRSRRKHPESMDAYDHFLQGTVLLEDPIRGVRQWDRIVDHLDRAVELDPGFPHALAYAGFAHEGRHTLLVATPPGVDDFALASELCGRALAEASNDALLLAVAANERHAVGDDGDAALALSERALALNPHNGIVRGNLRGKVKERSVGPSPATHLGSEPRNIDPVPRRK